MRVLQTKLVKINWKLIYFFKTLITSNVSQKIYVDFFQILKFNLQTIELKQFTLFFAPGKYEHEKV